MAMLVKKRISLILIFVLVLLACSMPAFSASENPEAVFLSEKGIMIGSSDGDLMLEQNFTIEQLMTVLARLAGKENEAKAFSPSDSFKDVPKDRWSAPYIAWAKANGISKGNPDGTIGYADNVTAQRLAAFLLRTLGYVDVEWGDVWSFSKLLGLFGIEGMQPADVVIRGDVARIVHAALNTPTRGGEKLGIILGVIEGKGSLKTLEPSEISAMVSPSVVYIEVYDENEIILASGSGFIADSDGIIVTNYHVIDGAYSAKVKLIDGRSLDVSKVLGYDYHRDIAVLKVNATDIASVKLGDSDKIVSGERILAIGSPIGLENTISDGLVSNRSRAVNEKQYIQISAPISEGSSGGALINYKGEVIGVTSAMFVSGQNLNLAIPINDVKPFLEKDEDITLAHLAVTAPYGSVAYDNAQYSGELKSRIPHGDGTLIWASGDIYTGEFVDGYRSGFGLYKWPDGDYYIGEFVQDKIEGKGTYYWTNGDIYTGQWKNDNMDGEGTFTFADGTEYSGTWKEGFYQSGVNPPQKVRAYAISSSEIEIGWDQVEGADYYYIYYSENPEEEWYYFSDEEGNKSPQHWAGNYSSTLTDCLANTTYHFKITTVVDGFESLDSNIISATTKAEN